MKSATCIAVLVGAVLLAACGGSGGGDEGAGAGGGAGAGAGAGAGGGGEVVTPPPAPDPGPGPAPAPTTLVSGVVAVGAPLAGATVRSLCGNGEDGPSTTTNAQGAYELRVPAACPSPWLLEATPANPGPRLFSFGGPSPALPLAPERQEINVTPASEILMEVMIVPQFGRRVLGLEEMVSFWRSIDLAQYQGALADVLAALNSRRPAGSTPLTLLDILHKTFEPRPGNPVDDLLEYLQGNQGTVTAAALMEQVRRDGGDLASGQPWKTAFGGAANRTWTGTDCTASGTPVGTATVTLRMEERNLQVVAASDAFGTPLAFTVGPAGRSDFQLILQGSTPYVRMAASDMRGKRIEFWEDAGTPKLTLSNLGSSVVCTLASPVRRADLASFQTAARILSVVPAEGTSGTCPATASGPAYGYAISPLGDVRFDGNSLAPDWLEGQHAYYSESLQYGFGGPGASFQVQLSASATRQGIQPYSFAGAPYLNCVGS